MRATRPPNVTPQFLPMQRLLWLVLVGVLFLLALFALGRSIQKTYESGGAIDLHPYWYYGHFVRAGINPYTAFASGAELPEAVGYVDGSVVAPDAVRQPRLAQIPANTAPLLFVITLFSYFPWTIAKTLWLICCLALLLATPWLALRLLPSSLRLAWELNWVVVLSFYAMKGSRVAIANGQPSILVFFLMIVTLLLRQSHWLWAGVALGVAMSKYSIALPVAIYLLFEQRFRLLIVAGLVQLVGLVAMAALAGGGIFETLQVYWGMVAYYSEGIHGLVNLGLLFHDQPTLLSALVAIGTLITLGAVVISWRRGWQANDLVAVNSLLALWTVLAAYHRVYDTMLVLLFWILCLAAYIRWQHARWQAQALAIFWLLSVAVMCVPGDIVPPFVSAAQAEMLLRWVEWSVTLAMMAMWAVNLWLLSRTPRIGV